MHSDSQVGKYENLYMVSTKCHNAMQLRSNKSAVNRYLFECLLMAHLYKEK